jgi:hypothetical protein
MTYVTAREIESARRELRRLVAVIVPRPESPKPPEGAAK